MNANISSGLGCVFAGLGVIAGAFGAHALKAELSPEMLAVYNKGVLYQFIHAFALLFAGRAISENCAAAKFASWCFALGIVAFSGSLYLLSTLSLSWAGPITPFGGSAFILGWIALSYSAFSSRTVPA